MAICDRKKIKKVIRSGSTDSASLLRKINNKDLIAVLNGIKSGSGDLVRSCGLSKLVMLEGLKGIIHLEASGEEPVSGDALLNKVLVAERLIREIRSLNRDLSTVVRELGKP